MATEKVGIRELRAGLADYVASDVPIGEWCYQDFFGTGVPTWTTDRVELYLNNTH